MRQYLIILVAVISFFSCKINIPQIIVDQSILAHGGKLFKTSEISFDFRNKHYTYKRQKNNFEYTRSFQDTLGLIEDVYTNEGFTRFIKFILLTIRRRQWLWRDKRKTLKLF